MRALRTIVALILAGVVCGAVAAEDAQSLAKKQSSLSAEYSLAKDPNFYFVLDVAGRKIELRVRGMVLRSWPLKDMRFWGRPTFLGNVELVRKSALKAPQRIIIKGGGAEPAEGKTPAGDPAASQAVAAKPGEFDLEALEIMDMPKTFSLDFDNGLHVRILSRSAGAGGLLKSLRRAWGWYVELPLGHLFGSGGEKRSGELELTLDNDRDAQAIYWHFFDGIKGVIL